MAYSIQDMSDRLEKLLGGGEVKRRGRDDAQRHLTRPKSSR